MVQPHFFYYCALVWYNRPVLLHLRNKNPSAMIGNMITLALAALAVWLLVDSAVEFVRDGQEDTLATEP